MASEKAEELVDKLKETARAYEAGFPVDLANAEGETLVYITRLEERLEEAGEIIGNLTDKSYDFVRRAEFIFAYYNDPEADKAFREQVNRAREWLEGGEG